MGDDVKHLYRIVGKQGPELRRVQEAMQWLLSPKAQGIGQELLHDAYALHDKPVTVEVSEDASNGYMNASGEHTIRINPGLVEKLATLDADGTPHLTSVERCLGHEMKHAGQPQNHELAASLSALDNRISQLHQSRLTPAQIDTQNELMIRALHAPDYDTARQLLGTYVDNVVLPMRAKVEPELFAHPDYVKLIEMLESPAVKVENQIATLRGEPARTDYKSSHLISPENKREGYIDELSSVLELSSKPRLDTKGTQRADSKPWATSLGKRSGHRRG